MYFMSDPQALHVTRNVIPGKLGVDLHLQSAHNSSYLWFHARLCLYDEIVKRMLTFVRSCLNSESKLVSFVSQFRMLSCYQNSWVTYFTASGITDWRCVTIVIGDSSSIERLSCCIGCILSAWVVFTRANSLAFSEGFMSTDGWIDMQVVRISLSYCICGFCRVLVFEYEH